MSRYRYHYVIPHKYFNINDLWFSVKRDIIYDVIMSASSLICFDIPDFEPKWDSIPEEKMNEWSDYVFNNDIYSLKPICENRIGHIIESRLYKLRDIICEFFMEKFNIKVVNGKYARNLDEENNVEPKRKEINEKIE